MGDPNADQVTACFFGDGASNNGQFFETLNMAALWKLPIIFVIENNDWAIGMKHHRATSDVRIHKKAEAFGIPGFEVDGMDVMAVREHAQDAIRRGRAGEGPTAFVTWRPAPLALPHRSVRRRMPRDPSRCFNRLGWMRSHHGLPARCRAGRSCCSSRTILACACVSSWTKRVARWSWSITGP
jgi:hypothetical protein